MNEKRYSPDSAVNTSDSIEGIQLIDIRSSLNFDDPSFCGIMEKVGAGTWKLKKYRC